jgi:hypothetical protein
MVDHRLAEVEERLKALEQQHKNAPQRVFVTDQQDKPEAA